MELVAAIGSSEPVPGTNQWTLAKTSGSSSGPPGWISKVGNQGIRKYGRRSHLSTNEKPLFEESAFEGARIETSRYHNTYAQSKDFVGKPK